MCESPPIVACNSLRSMAGTSGFASVPKTSSARFSSCWCRSLICVGCRSYFCAISAWAFSPRRSPVPRGAIDACEWFRRGASVHLMLGTSLRGRFQANLGETVLIALFIFSGPPLISHARTIGSAEAKGRGGPPFRQRDGSRRRPT